MKAQLIKPNGEIVDIQPDNGKDFKLRELYSLIDCELVEIVYLPNKKIMVVDEEGKLKVNPIYNEKAPNIAQGHEIVGNAIVCDSKMFR